jgi:hypothetical protein
MILWPATELRLNRSGTKSLDCKGVCFSAHNAAVPLGIHPPGLGRTGPSGRRLQSRVADVGGRGGVASPPPTAAVAPPPQAAGVLRRRRRPRQRWRGQATAADDVVGDSRGQDCSCGRSAPPPPCGTDKVLAKVLSAQSTEWYKKELVWNVPDSI